MINSTEPNQVKVFYDGLCKVCSAEINHYKKMNGSHRIQFIDITTSDFDASKENLDPQKIHVELHAKDREGNVLTGVDTFILIWDQIDKLNWLGRLAKGNFFKSLLKIQYSLFVQIRPYLPRKACADSPYCEIKTAP